MRVKVDFTLAEWEGLIDLAEQEVRDLEMEIRWLVRQALISAELWEQAQCKAAESIAVRNEADD